MPRGVPVATVAINGSKNAGILAAQIIGLKDSDIQKKVLKYKEEMKEEVVKKADKLEEIGYSEYLK
jgi:5-(carboxyamino)imidazole ribonucleotide mutase